MEITDVDVFNQWILKHIKPICLADPESLARYVVVLLKKNNPKPDLRSYCIQNLSIFIDNSKTKVEDFVDMVLDAVENKKYKPAEQAVTSENSSVKQQQPSSRHDHSKNRPSSKHARSRSRSPVSGRRDVGHSSRMASLNAKNDSGSDARAVGRSSSKHSRSSDREALSRSPHSHGSRLPAGNASENEDRASKKICPTFEQQGYCLNGDLCIYTHPGSLPVEEKDIHAIAATYQAAASTQLFQADASGSFSVHKPTDFSQQALNASSKNAHISPVLASYLQLGFQQIAAAAAVDPIQQQILQVHQDPHGLFQPPFAGTQQLQQQLSSKQHLMGDELMIGERDNQTTNVPVVVSSRAGGFSRRQDMSNLRQVRRNEFGSVGGAGPRKFDNRYGAERPPISASQLDNEMDEIAQANAAARSLDPGADQSSQDNNISYGGNNSSEQTSSFGPRNSGPGSGYSNRPFRGRGGGRGFHQRGGRLARGAGGVGRGHQADVSNNILEVRKIPAQLNSIGPLHEHFSTFGPVVNIQVNFEGDPEAAVITFANHSDALEAYRSPNPLFNNRFIKLFWHHKEQQQQQQPGGSEQQKTEMNKFGQDFEQQQFSQPNKTEASGEGQASGLPLQQQQQQQQQQRQSQSQQQSGPKPPPRAKLRIDHVGEEKAKVTEAQNDLAKRRRLLLANYLEMRKSLADKLKASTSESVTTEVTVTLKTVDDKINALKAELGLAKAEQKAKAAQQQGQQPGAAADAAKTPPKPGAKKESFTVDRRPKQLLISSVTGLDAALLRSHFALFCSVDGVESSSSGYIVTFSSRRDAEVAKARGLVFRGEQVPISWHQPLFYNQPFYSSATNIPNTSQQEQQLASPSAETKTNVAAEKTLFDDPDSEEERQQLQQQTVETS